MYKVDTGCARYTVQKSPLIARSRVTQTHENITNPILISIFGRLGDGRLVGHHNELIVESPSPRSQSTMKWMRSSGQIGLLPADTNLQGTLFPKTSYIANFKIFKIQSTLLIFQSCLIWLAKLTS